MKDLERVKSKGQKDLSWGKGEEEKCFQNNSPIYDCCHWVASGIFHKDRKYKKEEEMWRGKQIVQLWIYYLWNMCGTGSLICRWGLTEKSGFVK